ncbi:MAG: hypothetical protein ACI9FN_001732, partial [Saprospiraceae bacterium]
TISFSSALNNDSYMGLHSNETTMLPGSMITSGSTFQISTVGCL